MHEEPREFGKREAERALDRLWVILRSHGHGTITRVERELGLPAKTLSSWKGRRQLRYADLRVILRSLDEDPGSFFAGLFPESDDTGSTHHSRGLPGIVWQAEYLVYEDPLLCLRLLSEQYDGRWETSLAIAKSLKVLELWRESEIWVRRSIDEAPTAKEKSLCRLLLAPILALPKNDPQAAISIVRQCRPLLSGSDLALAHQYESLALRAAGDLSPAARSASLALIQPKVSGPTQAGAFQILGLILKDVGDRPTAVQCLRQAYNVFAGTYTRGYSLWALARALDGARSKRLYLDTLSVFQRSFPFEAFKVCLELFERFGYDKVAKNKLHQIASCNANLFAAVLVDIEESRRYDRGFAGIAPELEAAWNRWLRSQAALSVDLSNRY